MSQTIKKRCKCCYCHKKRYYNDMYKLRISFTHDIRNICKECFSKNTLTLGLWNMSPQGDTIGLHSRYFHVKYNEEDRS